MPRYRAWNDAWDAPVDSGVQFEFFSRGSRVWTWYQGYWWKSIVQDVSPRYKTLKIKFYDTGNRVVGYKPRLVKFRF